MASFDCDVVIIGSGFGGSVAALRAAEKGYRVGNTEVSPSLSITALAERAMSLWPNEGDEALRPPLGPATNASTL